MKMNKKEYSKEYYLKNREREIKRSREYKLKNKEKEAAYNLKYRPRRREVSRAWYLNNTERSKAQRKIYRSSPLGKAREKETTRIYRSKHKEQAKAYHIQYYQIPENLENKKKVEAIRLLRPGVKERKSKVQAAHRLRTGYNGKYYLRNKKHLIKQVTIYATHKRKTDVNWRLRLNLRNRVYLVLKGYSKSAHTMELIGCTIAELWKHLESKFKPWMTRENYGLWHVDHIKACAKFNLADPAQQRICFHWSNLQPLWAHDNLSKGSR
jgi:hypothetical protein